MEDLQPESLSPDETPDPSLSEKAEIEASASAEYWVPSERWWPSSPLWWSAPFAKIPERLSKRAGLADPFAQNSRME
jgi:hypothetical protein